MTASGGTGTYTYAWSSGDNTAITASIAAGSYTVTVTSGTQTATASVSVGQPAVSLSATFTTNPSSQGQATGNAAVYPSGGTTPYTYLWSNGGIDPVINNQPAGTYTVTVTDANGCTFTGSATIGTIVPPLEITFNRTDMSCYGVTDGTAQVNAYGGTGSYSFAWSNGAITQSISALSAGNYTVTVTSGPYTQTGSVLISEPAEVVLNASATDATNGNNGTASVNPSGGTGTYAVYWSTQETSNTISNLAPGTYNVTVVDTDNCGNTASVVVNDANPPACSLNEVTVRVQLDNYPQETGWTVYDANNQVVGFGNGYTGQPGVLVEETLCLPDGCYNFQITDAYGDGICCAYGNGFYEVVYNGTVLVSGGQFGVQEVKPFCLNATPQINAEQGFVSNVGDTWQFVALQNSYVRPVVIATPVVPNTGFDPVVTRVRNVSNNGFELRVQRPGNATNDTYRVEYFVVEEGVYTQATHGIDLEAVRVFSTKTAARGRWGSNYREARNYQNNYQNPVVLGQVMSQFDGDFSVFWASQASSQKNAPSAGSFAAGKHVAEDPDRTRIDEEIGYVVFEAGGGQLAGLDFRAGVGADIVRGQANSSQGYLYPLTDFQLFGGVLSSAAMDGGDGGWPVFKSDVLGTGGIALAIDEDQLKDNERGHTDEQVAYLVFGQELTSNLQAPAPDATTPIGPVSAAPRLPITHELQVFPNPTAGATTVRWTATPTTRARLQVSDLSGRVRYTLHTGAGETTHTLTTTDWTPGIYLVQVLTSDGQRLYQRLVVQ